ncbi:MAG: xanthine dehydrogenase molybdopterin binding subunit, partial [Rhodobacteraceae bacterium]|nr:xanthine dehydrogenase molybdopterin binding subunit [Paracoccaceae bacterium]
MPHDAAPLHVTGTARYVDDIPLPAGALHLAFGLSSVAHGDITAMDLAPVRAAPGVVAVLSAADFDPVPDCSPSLGDEPIFATGRVHFHGQPLFLVIAESHLAARRAARLAKVSYAELPALLTVDDALAAGSRFESGPIIWEKGDVDTAIADAPHRVEGRFDVGGQEHFYLEGQVAAAIPMEGGDILIHSSTQHPTEVQHKVAHALHLPMSAVRVEVRRMGGGFGGKESQGNWLAIACALAARATGRPCKMRYDRDDDMVITGKRHDLRILYKAGFDAEGRLAGVEFTHLVRCGWSQDLSLAVADRAMQHTDNAYHLPTVRITSHRLRTNTASATAYRGFGGPQGIIGIERVIDHIAHHLGQDANSIRAANYYTEMGTNGPAQTTPYKMVVEDSISHALTQRLLEGCDYTARRAAVDKWNAENPILKRGLAMVPVKFGISFTLTFLNQAGALVHVYQDGSVHLNHGGTE